MSRIMTNFTVSLPLELSYEIFGRSADDIVNSVDLVQLVVTWKKWIEAQNFKEHTSYSPYIHLSFL